ncbi:hypothetical protein D3C71_1446910 [compost metagenome]
MFHLLGFVELQHGVGAVKAVVLRGDRQTVPGAEVFNLNPALPAARVATLHACRFQFGGVLGQVLPGFRRLIRVQTGFFEGVFVVVQNRRGAVKRLGK